MKYAHRSKIYLSDAFQVVVTSLIFILMFLELIPASPQLEIFCIKFLTLQEKLTTFGSSAFLYNSRVGLSRLEIAGKLIELCSTASLSAVLRT